MGVAEEEGAFVATGTAEPGGHLFVALAGVAGGASGDDVFQGITAAAGDGKNTVALEGLIGRTAVGTAAPGLLEGGPLGGGEIVIDAVHPAFAPTGRAGGAGATEGHCYRVRGWRGGGPARL